MNWKQLLSTKRIRKSKKNPNDIRNVFESDLGRIIYSPALRRMHDKTQVFPLTTDDNIHTRLTHSTEVMSLGYTFGLKCSQSKIIQDKTGMTELELLREIPIILQSVCLIHDIGNPPFGHFAEDIVSEYFRDFHNNPNISDAIKKSFAELTTQQKADFIFYDGNAQGLRVVTKLQYLDDRFGLNLTYAILGAYLKYPNIIKNDNFVNNELTRDEIKKEIKKLKKENIGEGKHGVFFTERDEFNKIVKECGLFVNNKVIRHPLCYLMEASDSIAYRVMDIEDGFSKGLISIQNIIDEFNENQNEFSSQIISICNRKEITCNVKMVLIRIELINYLVKLAFDNFENNLEDIEKGEYNFELIEVDPHNVDKVLENLCCKYIFSSREINSLETTGFSVLNGLLNHYIKQLFHENVKFTSRATALISKSLISVALEEELLLILEKKLISLDKENSESLIELSEKFINLYQENRELIEVDFIEEKKLRKQIFKGFESLGEEINFNDLTFYSRLRVIVDFISGMTDQYALSHYQKISGQKIA